MIRLCRFPLWNHKERPTQVYCDKPVKDGSSYCAEHHSVVWQKPPKPEPRKDDLAKKAERQFARMF